MTLPESAIYTGTIRHRRFRPASHAFTYKVFLAFLDVDRIPELMSQMRFGAYNRFQWASFYQQDHFGNASQSLRARLAAQAAEQGIVMPDGPIFLLTHLRYLGHCFNPISVFYCYGKQSGQVEAMVAEVNSTFGETHNYWLTPANQQPSHNSLRYRCAKRMHVSPFMKMDLDYDFTMTEPADQLVAHLQTLDSGSPFFDATLDLRRQPWTSANLTKALLKQPWMTAKVVAAIHWQAIRIWWKGVPVVPHPGMKKV